MIAPVYRGIYRTPTCPGVGLNSGPHASQHSGLYSSHCAIESGLEGEMLTLPILRIHASKAQGHKDI